MKQNLVGLLGVMLTLILSASAQVEQPKPMPNTYVHDFAKVIPKNKQAEINAKAKQLKELYQTEIALVTVNSLRGEDQFDYSMRMARSWGIGSPDNSVRGLLILVAIKDRKTSFRTSRHIEGELPDGVTGDISRAMNVFFKKGDFGSGLSAGMSLILDRMKLAYQPPAPPRPQPQPQPQPDGQNDDIIFAVLFFLTFGIAGLIGWAIKKLRSFRLPEGAAFTASRSAPRNHYYSPSTWSSSASTTPVSSYFDSSSTSKRDEPDDDRSSHTSSSFWPSSSSHDDSSSSSSSYSSGSSSSFDSSSSSSGSDSSSSSDSDASYSGGSDFGGGGSDSSW